MKQYSIKNPPELPASCPPLPEGYVYLGRGNSFSALPTDCFQGLAINFGGGCRHWGSGEWVGDSYDLYAAPEGSEIVKLNFGEPLGPWADKLPRPYIDLAVRRFAEQPCMARNLQHARFVDLFEWEATPEKLTFWSRVDDFIDGTRDSLPPIPDAQAQLAEGPAPEPTAPKSLAEQIAAVEKRLAEQDAVLLQIKNLLSDYYAK